MGLFTLRTTRLKPGLCEERLEVDAALKPTRAVIGEISRSSFDATDSR